MIKAMMLITGIFVSLPALGSHFIDCDVKAKVTNVQRLARLDAAAVFSRDPEIADHEEVLELEVIEVLRVDGRDQTCLSKGSKVELYVQPDSEKQYKAGDELNLNYRNVGDARASRVSWISID